MKNIKVKLTVTMFAMFFTVALSYNAFGVTTPVQKCQNNEPPSATDCPIGVEVPCCFTHVFGSITIYFRSS